jgi:hypothetical protein
MTFPLLANVLWAASVVGHVTDLGVMVIRKRARSFPIFTTFLLFEILRTVFLFLVSRYGTKHGYFLAYWETGFGDYILQVGLIFEIAKIVLRPTGQWIVESRRNLIILSVAGTFAAASYAMMMGPNQAKGLDLWDARVTVFTSLLTCELFLAMSVTANKLGIPWRSHVFALGQGLSIWAFVAVAEELGNTIFSWGVQFPWFVYSRMFVYLSVLVYWAVSFWLPEKQRAPLSPAMQAYLLALHKQVQYDLTKINRGD